MYNTATETAYRRELKEKILRVATALFHRYGIRRVKMDDIANDLKISKRTLYEIYSNKEKLLLEVMRNDKLVESRRMEGFDRPGSNVINIVIEVCKYRIEEFSQINPLFFEDIHKYPELLAHVRKLHEQRESDVLAFMQRGIDEGLFLPDINYGIVRTLTNASQQAIMNLYLYKKYDVTELAHVAILLFIRGFCTPEGVRQLDEQLESLAWIRAGR
ncbi:TetR/AcrR family transcriptional regulator [Prevotella multiformis]|jgi:transcriptional regulator, tetR family|uniref:TetR/AcrR family transcriptional regulator n=1 Tax=Prevotella multiformis TaxID=282402 RepID=UPI001BAC4858|nr:TetR/AcrR family transcriptional regulator [Prevotella multiformis]QUB72297.1 TetR/AcrR family transcriptional regulator [Prevotella multiformis]